MRITGRIVAIIVSALGALMMAAATTAPTAVDSNIAAWLRVFGVQNPPPAFATSHADQWAFWLGLLVLLVGLVGVWEWFFAKPKSAAPVGGPKAPANILHRKREPKRDTTLSQAIAYHISGSWDQSVSDALGTNPDKYDEALAGVTQLARDGKLTIWGRPSESAPHEIIEPAHWREFQIDALRTAYNQPCTEN